MTSAYAASEEEYRRQKSGDRRSSSSERFRGDPDSSTSSGTARLSSEMNATSSIPIPRLPAAYHAPSSSHRSTSYSSQSQHHSSARSPSGSSLSSYRSHPYTRRPSQPNKSPTDLPRILLPPPGSGTPLHTGVQSDSGQSVPPLSALALQSPPESSRPAVLRTLSGDRPPRSGPGSIQLPPLHSISAPSPRSPSTMAPPMISRNSNSPGPGTGRFSPGPHPPAGYSAGLRPSYAAYEQYPTPSTRHSPGEYEHYVHSRRESRPHSEYAYARQEYYDPPSPPLRALPLDLRSAHHHSRHQGLPSPYSTPHSAHVQVSSDYHSASRRSRSQSTHSTQVARGATHSQHDPEGAGAAQAGPGQNRRIAHLMSEQKRRESINSGFNALRTALPGAIATDSKAIILRKAVTHIQQLEAMLRKAGINPNGGGATGHASGPPALTPSSWDDHENDMEGEGDGDDDSRTDDVIMEDDEMIKKEEVLSPKRHALASRRDRWKEDDERMREDLNRMRQSAIRRGS